VSTAEAMSFHMNFFQNLILWSHPHYKTINNLSYKPNITTKNDTGNQIS